MAGFDGFCCRMSCLANFQVSTDMAARLEAAAGRQIIQSRRVARDGSQLRAGFGNVGECLQQALGVGMLWIVENGIAVGVFGHGAAVHDQHIVTHFGHQAQVVGDKHQRKVELPLQVVPAVR